MPDEMEALRQMAAGLKYIHSEDLVHGDIKPSNILIYSTQSDSRTLLKLSDFGFRPLATSPEYFLEKGMKVPPYLAPELLGETAASPSSDVFALGYTFFEFLIGGTHSSDHESGQHDLSSKFKM